MKLLDKVQTFFSRIKSVTVKPPFQPTSLGAAEGGEEKVAE